MPLCDRVTFFALCAKKKSLMPVFFWGEASPYGAIFHHHAVRSARRDDGKYAPTPSAPAAAPVFVIDTPSLLSI